MLCQGARLVPRQDFEGKKHPRACDWLTNKTNTIFIGREVCKIFQNIDSYTYLHAFSEH